MYTKGILRRIHDNYRIKYLVSSSITVENIELYFQIKCFYKFVACPLFSNIQNLATVFCPFSATQVLMVKVPTV